MIHLLHFYLISFIYHCRKRKAADSTAALQKLAKLHPHSPLTRAMRQQQYQASPLTKGMTDVQEDDKGTSTTGGESHRSDALVSFEFELLSLTNTLLTYITQVQPVSTIQGALTSGVFQPRDTALPLGARVLYYSAAHWGREQRGAGELIAFDNIDFERRKKEFRVVEGIIVQNNKHTDGMYKVAMTDVLREEVHAHQIISVTHHSLSFQSDADHRREAASWVNKLAPTVSFQLNQDSRLVLADDPSWTTCTLTSAQLVDIAHYATAKLTFLRLSQQQFRVGSNRELSQLVERSVFILTCFMPHWLPVSAHAPSVFSQLDGLLEHMQKRAVPDKGLSEAWRAACILEMGSEEKEESRSNSKLFIDTYDSSVSVSCVILTYACTIGISLVLHSTDRTTAAADLTESVPYIFTDRYGQFVTAYEIFLGGLKIKFKPPAVKEPEPLVVPKSKMVLHYIQSSKELY